MNVNKENSEMQNINEMTIKRKGEREHEHNCETSCDPDGTRQTWTSQSGAGYHHLDRIERFGRESNETVIIQAKVEQHNLTNSIETFYVFGEDSDKRCDERGREEARRTEIRKHQEGRKNEKIKKRVLADKIFLKNKDKKRYSK